MHRRTFLSGCAAAAAACGPVFGQASGTPFTQKYRTIRKRLETDFLVHDQIAKTVTPSGKEVVDGTYVLGFAYLTLAGEARLLARAGADPKPTESLLRRLLNTFDRLDVDAERSRYKTAVRGFFLRDFVAKEAGIVSSDFSNPDPSNGDMSLDQVVMLMAGWWGVARWSTDEGNRKLAKAQADRVMDYLLAQRFMIERPGTHELVHRGDDARGAAGFLCDMAEDITGEDYYHRAKVRLLHDNKCHTCAGTGQVNAPDPNLQCVACSGTGHLKVVIGGGKCQICRGTGDVKIVTESQCPACRGSGEIRVVVTDWLGNDHTLGRRKCDLCGGDGKIGGKTQLGKCKVCGGDGRLPEYTKDLGECKMCGGTGRWKGKLPRIKCPVCGGSKELNLYVKDTHPLVVKLEKNVLDVGVFVRPKLKYTPPAKIEISSGGKIGSSYARHLVLVCTAFEESISDAQLLRFARDSSHPWSVALRAATTANTCQACRGRGRLLIMVPSKHSVNLHAPLEFSRVDAGPCPTCGGKGTAEHVGPVSGALAGVADDLVRLHRLCPPDGPSAKSPSPEWARDNRWERCMDKPSSPGEDRRYNGLDFLSMEVLMRLTGLGDRLKG